MIIIAFIRYYLVSQEVHFLLQDETKKNYTITSASTYSPPVPVRGKGQEEK